MRAGFKIVLPSIFNQNLHHNHNKANTMNTYYARSIINGKEIQSEIETQLHDDHISIIITDQHQETDHNQILNIDLIRMAIFDQEINYQLKAAGVYTPNRKGIITQYGKNTDDQWTFCIQLK